MASAESSKNVSSAEDDDQEPHFRLAVEHKETHVLDPDNPLLEKFQKALKEHLVRQIEHLRKDLFEYETGIRKNNARREELGILVYETQQTVQKQQTTLDNYSAKLETTIAAHEEVENVLAEKRELFKKEREKLIEAETEEIKLRNEIEGTNLLIYQMNQWEDTLESDITVRKRMFEKSRKDKLKLLEDKRAQDALIYKLMTRIWYLERELNKMDIQLAIKEEEREELAQTVALGNTNIEAMEAEYRCLLHSWNSVIIAIGNRDKVLSCLAAEIKKSEEKFKSIIAEIQSVKKLSEKEMRRNEELTMMKTRFVADIQKCKSVLETEAKKKEVIERRMIEMQRIIDQTEADIKNNEEESNDIALYLAALNREFDQLDTEKAALEERIMKELEDQVTSNKTVSALQRVLKMISLKNRETEIQVATMENKISRINGEVETQRFANFESRKYLEELEERLRELGKEADSYQEELKKIALRINKRTRDVDLLNNKLQRIVEKAGGVAYTSPLESKIVTLEKNIEEIQAQNKKLQQFWLREQTNLLKISEQRQEQIQTNNILRKQILILEQKNLKVTDELDALKKQQDKVMRSINNLHSQLTVMGDNFCKTKGLKVTMDKDNEVLRQDYIYKLKDAELECLKLEDEIQQLEEDKVNMSNELIEMNRSALEWEKKFLSVKEAKSTMLDEQSKEGEVGSMRAEIHRMNVRYSQLKKVQDVLVQDLEHCITRRDAIMTVAEAREKRHKGGVEKTRINFSRKLDDIRNKTKQMENQTEELKKKMEAMESDKMKLEKDIKEIEEELCDLEKEQDGVKGEIDEAITQRQMNFELLLQLQKKLNIYTDVSKGRKPHLAYRSEGALTTEYNKEIELNSNLSKIVENLQEDFPNRNHELTRVLNTLKLPVYVYYQ